MRKSGRTSAAVVAMATAGMSLAACGSSSSRDVVIARVGSVPITRAAVSHWMGTFAGEVYFELSGKQTVPAGLVSDPPNYKRCVTRLEAAAANSPKTKAKPTGVQLFGKCQQLYQAFKTQAVTFLVKSQWTIASLRDLGISVSEREVAQFLSEFKKRKLPEEEGGFQRYLTRRRLGVGDVMLNLKLNLLAQKAAKELEPKGERPPRQALARYNEVGQRWTLKTTCKRGYVVEHCEQYKGGPTYPSSPPPSILMEQVAALATGRCINIEACGKQ
jgi:hypothetical protein